MPHADKEALHQAADEALDGIVEMADTGKGINDHPCMSKDEAYAQALLRYLLVNHHEGGLLAQRHCAHLALDFLLGKPQDALQSPPSYPARLS